MRAIGSYRLTIIVSLVGVALATAGCEVKKPQPGSWWGVRQVREKSQARKRETARKEKSDFTNKDLRNRRTRQRVEKKEPSEFGRAVELVRSQRFAEAKNILLRLVEENPRHAESFRWLGDCYYNLLELPESMEAYSRARELDPSNYFALRGKGFASLHYGHQAWNEKDYDKAHKHYKRSLELLQQCLRLYPADSEAMYGRAMAAEGATRKLYANAIRLKRADKDNEAEVMARNCLEVIDEGIKSASFRINAHLDEVGPRALVGGLFLRRAMLLKEFGRMEPAISGLRKAADTHRSILREIDENNVQAKRELEKCERLMEVWKQESGNNG